jgi:hypothetical protein
MQLWTDMHIKTLLPSILIMAAVALILGKCLAKRSERIRMLPFQLFAVLLFVLEIFKQVISVSKGYDLYHIPRHFCSLFIFMLPLMSFYHGKYKNGIRAITTGLCAAVFILMCAYPELIYSGTDVEQYFQNFFSFHTVTFHNVVILEFFLIISLRLFEPRGGKKDTKPILLFMLGYCLIASVAAQLLQTNFNNFYQCNVPPLEEVRQSLSVSLGATPTQILYVLIVTALDLGFVFGAYWLYRLLYRLTRPLFSCKKSIEA